MVFESLGIFESNSLSSSVKALDAISKEKHINIVRKQLLGDGIVTILIKGELGAIKRAFSYGAEVIGSTNDFRGSHIIPLPHSKLLSIIGAKV